MHTVDYVPFSVNALVPTGYFVRPATPATSRRRAKPNVSEDTRPAVVYILMEPDSRQVRYVGRTVQDAEARYAQHLADTYPCRRTRWIADLQAIGQMPIQDIIEHAPAHDIDDAERFWIAYFRSVGADLLNQTDGGECLVGPISQAADANRRLQLLVNEGIAAKRPLADADDTDGRWRDYQAFIGLAGHLQVAVGDQNIMLPCDKVGDVMGVSKMTVSRYRRWAIEDGYLVLMKKHQFRSKGRGDATEFRFNTDRFKCLQAKAQVGTTDVFQRRG